MTTTSLLCKCDTSQFGYVKYKKKISYLDILDFLKKERLNPFQKLT